MNEFEFSPDDPVRLEAFENPDKSRKYTIEFTCPEWTALCPRSGFPDFGVIHIKYEPRECCVELKSLKLYINSYRNQRLFHEAAVNKILT
ncbi:MAG: preQ(1) synthase, partial [Proteobacteria bacterium]|nr:preQ(1) synthase [Pseudomonadota bacterium]